MKVLMIERYLYPFGGAQTYMLAVADWLKEQGHDVEFFGMQYEKNVVGNSAGQYTRCMDFHSHSLSRFTYPFTILYSREARKKLRKVIDTFKPDLVHLHGFNFQLTPSVIYEVKQHGLPLITTVHDAQIACPCHRLYIEHKGKPCTACITGEYRNCARNRCVSGSLIKSVLAMAESYLYHALRTYDMIDRFILPSRFMYDVLKTNGVPEEKMTVLQNFSRMERPKKPAARAGEKYILYFGRLGKEKGVETLATVCKRLPEVKFKIAGTGPMADAFSGLDNVETLGFVGVDALQKLIREAAFSVYPSEWYENCPMSVLESQVLGTPVIGARIGGIPELIQEGQSGLLFESGSADSLRQAVEKLYFDGALIKEMQAYCAAHTSLMDTNDYGKALFVQYESLIYQGAEKCKKVLQM
jgi:glycosyltransferase involved in cell wall biosynthesis